MEKSKFCSNIINESVSSGSDEDTTKLILHSLSSKYDTSSRAINTENINSTSVGTAVTIVSKEIQYANTATGEVVEMTQDQRNSAYPSHVEKVNMENRTDQNEYEVNIYCYYLQF
jgi:hypothetical protein